VTIIFLIKSDTINISDYTIKDVPGSTGRLDVIARCILASILINNELDNNVKIYIFLNGLGNFLFDPEYLKKEDFPRNELLLSDLLVKAIQNNKSNIKDDSYTSQGVKIITKNIFEVIEQFQGEDFQCYILSKEGTDIFKIKERFNPEKNFLFIIGNQSGDFLKSPLLEEKNLPKISLGSKLYLASSCIRLLKLNFFL
jgi:tRNA (pseudouridine54-N1)-methyltransferase